MSPDSSSHGSPGLAKRDDPALHSDRIGRRQRQTAYVLFSELIQADEAAIPLYPVLQMDARKNFVEGWQSNGNDFVIWNSQDWWLNQ
jgi:hypothetical protein